MKSIICILLIYISALIWYYPVHSESTPQSIEDPSELLYQADFYKIYTEIFKPSCAVSGCHDGSFEPNFTSIQSSYFTLVWHTIIKNNREEKYQYRVVPGDTSMSVLYKRITDCCFVDQHDRMPFYDKEGLSAEHIHLIADWIKNGAKDIFGHSPEMPCFLPHIEQIQISQKNSLQSDIQGEWVYNELGELFAQKINHDTDSLHIALNIQQDKYSCGNISSYKYFIQLYNDAGFTNIILEKPLEFISASSKLFSILPGKLLLDSSIVYLRVKIVSDKRTYYYPNQSTPYELMYKWTLRK